VDNASLLTKFETYLLTERRVAQNTLYAYRQDIVQFNNFLAQENRPLQEVTRADIKGFLKELRALAIGPRSVSRKISSLKLFFGFLEDRFGIKNKVTDIISPKFKRALPTFLSQEETDQLLSIADLDTSPLGIRNKTMLYLLYVTGMRISELVTLELSSLHFDTGFIMVKGKGGKERMIPAPQSMMAMLRYYIQELHCRLLHNRQTDYLFPVVYGGVVKHITRQAFWGILHALWQKTGNKKVISPHKLRHSLATHMLQNGADLRALQLILGHENLATVEIYTHVETTHLRRVYDAKHPRSEVSEE